MYVLLTLIRIGLSCLFLQRPRVAYSARIFFMRPSYPFNDGVVFCSCLCCIYELHPIIFSVFNFSISKLCFPYMYVCMHVCTSFGGLDSRYPTVPTDIQISIILLPISRYCWILMLDPRYSTVILPLLFRYFFHYFFFLEFLLRF
jgi:hypothetical protein